MNRVLLDTHVLVWWLEGRANLSQRAREVIQDPETTVLVSAATAWELAIKAQLGKFKSKALVKNLGREILEEGFVELSITIDHALRVGGPVGSHKDPFDRLLIAQALCENVPLLSADESFDAYRVQRIW